MEQQDRIAQKVATFADTNRKALTVLAAAIHRATGDDETICFTRAWLLFRWARAQQEPRSAAAAMVRRMNEEKIASANRPRSHFPIPTWWTFPPEPLPA